MTVALCVVVAIMLLALSAALVRVVRARRETFVRTYMFPAGLFDRLAKKRPELSLKDRQLVAHTLRQFFLAHLRSGRRFVSMPSQVADDLWHEFILYTRHYERFCSKAFGCFMHHTPAVVLGGDRKNNEGLRRTWWYACLEENINPRKATRLPLLFAIDQKLGIPDGFRYAADCTELRKQRVSDPHRGMIYCGGDFGSIGTDGSTAGYGDSDAGGGWWGGGHGDSGGAHAASGCSGSADGGGGGGCSGGCSGGCGSS